MPNAVEEIRTRPISEFITVRTSCWSYKNKVLLIGDAAHSVVPFYGQGMNAAFEDVMILDRLLDRYGNSNWQEMFREFTSFRKPNTDTLAQLSLENFDELRDTARRPIVTARKKTSIFLNRLFRQHCIPLYTMVSHTTLPYSECVECHRRQERIARWLGIDLVLAVVALYQKIKTVLSNRRDTHLAQNRTAPPTLALKPLPDAKQVSAKRV
jgi:kynurenine 3-monooxygenase